MTTFYLQTLPAPPSVVNFGLEIPAVLNSKESAADAFLHIQNFARNASVVDRRLGLGMFITGTVFSIRGSFFGSLDEFNSKVNDCQRRTKEGNAVLTCVRSRSRRSYSEAYPRQRRPG